MRSTHRSEFCTQTLDSGRWLDIDLDEVPIPNDVYLALQKAGRISDPYIGTNECNVQWVNERDWEFQTTFSLPPTYQDGQKVVLVFEGLDTFATVSVDGQVVLQSDNMFISHRVAITELVRARSMEGKEHTYRMSIKFESAMAKGEELLKENGRRACWNGHYSRVYVRKAQYHYGWDWGPSLVTCGPWKPIHLEVYNARLQHVDAITKLDTDLKRARFLFRAKLDCSGNLLTDYRVDVIITPPSGEQQSAATEHTEDGVFAKELEIENAELWYPRGYGPQNLYQIQYILTDVSNPGVPIHGVTKTIGLRKVELVQDKLPEVPGDNVSGGYTFFFRINNIPTFCGGANWIPADSFQPRITRSKLKYLLRNILAERGNQIMIRVWGGGVYESEDFYDICDEVGVLVWQDIMMACADYPAHLGWFVKSVQKEVEENLMRLRWHPSLVIVAGNNEDYQVADEEVGYGSSENDKFQNEPFPSRHLYEQLFPQIVHSICNNSTGDMIGGSGGASGLGVVYWPGSPWSNEDSTDRTVGDIHQWHIWGGVQAPYQRYPDLGGRFISEFGMPSYPHFSTVLSFLSNSSPTSPDFHPQSLPILHHIKAHSFEKRFFPYILENYRALDGSFKEWIYLSQLMQADALSFAYRGWRGQWGKEGKRLCGGALVWQLNDVWPSVSWSIVDYRCRPKLAFYAIARALKPVTVIARRTTNDPKPNARVEALVRSKTDKGVRKVAMHSTPHVYPPKISRVKIVISNIVEKKFEGLHVVVRYVEIGSGNAKTVLERGNLEVNGNETIELYEGDVPEGVPTVVHVILRSAQGTVVARETDWPVPLKFANFSLAKLDIQEKEGAISIRTDKPVRGLSFEEMDGEEWMDNGADVLPGDEYEINVRHLRASVEGRWRHYGVPLRATNAISAH